jgi:histidinol-phosphate aminotransferase
VLRSLHLMDCTVRSRSNRLKLISTIRIRREWLGTVSVPKAIRRLIKDVVLESDGYAAVKSIEETAAELNIPVSDIVKLDQNENPYGTSLGVFDALATYDHFHQYPDASHRVARERISRYAGVPADRILIGNGSDEIIDMLFLLTLEPGDEVIVPMPTFGVYGARPPLYGGVVKNVERKSNFDLDVDAIVNAVTDRTKLIFLAHPNNPTGNLVTNQQLVRILRTGALVVVDEAYYEFSDNTLLPMLGEWENMVVLRTFSKWAGLAGLRVGYGIFPEKLGQQMWKVKPPFNVSVAGLKAIEAVLDDVDYLQETVSRIRVERGRLYRALRKLNFLEPYPSHGNYILCKVTRGDAHDVYSRLRRQGILVRSFRDPWLRHFVRISVGTPEDTTTLLRALRAMVEEV